MGSPKHVIMWRYLGDGCGEEVVWELDVQGHEQGAPRGSRGSAGAVGEGWTPSGDAIKEGR